MKQQLLKRKKRLIMMNENAMTIVNGCDKDFYNGNACKVHFGSYGEYCFLVYCNEYTSDTLDIIGEYCNNNGIAGLLNFSTYDEILADCDGDENILSEQWFPVNGGEYY